MLRHKLSLDHPLDDAYESLNEIGSRLGFHYKHGISLPEVLVSSFIGLMVLGILVFFLLYHSQYFNAWLSGSEAQDSAAAALKGMVENARLTNGFAIYTPSELRIRRDLTPSPGTPEDTSDDTWLKYSLLNSEINYTVIPPAPSLPQTRVLLRGVDEFNVTRIGNTIAISLTVTRGTKKVTLKDAATPRGMSLEGDSIP